MRLCKWPHISVSVSTLGYLLVCGYWRSKGKVVNFIAFLKMMSHVIFAALIDSSHVSEAFICQLYFVMILTHEGAVRGKFRPLCLP